MNKNISDKIFRKKLLIKKDIQFHFALVALTLMVSSSITIWLLMENMALQTMHFPLSSSQMIILTVIIADAAAAFLISLYFSHRLAGPLFNIERSLMELLDNHHKRPVKIRKHDFLQNLANLVNRVIEDWPVKKKG